MSTSDKIQLLRSNSSHLLSDKYDNDKNLERWLQGYKDFEEAQFMLQRHLKFRHFFNLDRVAELPRDHIVEQYFPLGLVGPTGVDNTLLVIETAGRVDLHGILKSVQVTSFLLDRLQFQESVLDAINEQERLNGSQSGVVHVIDLEGLPFDPSLLSILTGPYRITWQHVIYNYPEWIRHIVVINSPSYISILWKAISPFIPERTSQKVKIYGGKNEYLPHLLKLVKAENLPRHWGGKMVDCHGDPKCGSLITIPPNERIPPQLYWKPNLHTPDQSQLMKICIPARGKKTITLQVNRKEADYLVFYRFADHSYLFSIFCADSSKNQEMDGDLEWVEWCPEAGYAGMPTVDRCCITLPEKMNTFQFSFLTEGAWFFSQYVYFKALFLDENNDTVKHTEL